MKRILSVILVLVLLVGIGGTILAEDEYDIAVIIKATDSDFWQYVLIGARNAAKDIPNVKITTHGPPSEADIDKQVAILEDVINRKPNAIVIASTSSDATVPALERAYEQGIIIVTIDNRVNTDSYHSFLATDNMEAGGKAAKKLIEDLQAKAIPLEGKIGLISAMAGVQVLVDRDEGFISTLNEHAPNLRVLPTRYVDNDMMKAVAAVEDLLTANDDIIGFFADNNMTGNGLARVIEERNLHDKIVALAFDSDPEEIKALESGALKALVLQDPYGMGYIGVSSAYEALQGKTLEKYINTGSTVVTKDIMYDQEIVELLDPTLKE